MVFLSIFYYFKMIDIYFEKKRKKEMKVLVSVEFYIWYIYM